MNDAVIVEKDGPVRILTLNRPATRNSLSEEMLAALQAELMATSDDQSVRVVVLAANGPAGEVWSWSSKSSALSSRCLKLTSPRTVRSPGILHSTWTQMVLPSRRLFRMTQKPMLDWILACVIFTSRSARLEPSPLQT